MEESFSMTGGDGPYSYAKNSNKQKEAAERAKELLLAMILENLDIEQSSTLFTIVDLGCSTGPNTFIAVDNIIEGVTEKYYKIRGSSSQLPEFQVFFSDHVSNDFNILYANLPSNRKYFAAGVPGSFYERLFPKACLNFVYSAFALQWLSKAPQELGDLNSPACNKGRIYYANAPVEVGQAYSAQFAQDMDSFLEARAEELCPGGLMALIIPGRPGGTLPSQFSLGPLLEPLESCLLEMAEEGILCKDKIDSFNLPMYSPSIEELRTLIQRNGYFDIAKLESLPQRPIPLRTTEECRAGFESILKQHFGSEVIEQLFARYTTKIAGYPPASVGTDGIVNGLFVLLNRNQYSN